MTPHAVSRIACPLLALAAVLAFHPNAHAALGTAPAAGFPLPLSPAIEDRPLEGFGAQTPGGSGGTGYVVTTLADSGPGSLRDAVSGSGRIITFGVAGDILLQTPLDVGSSFLTIDGSTAPLPGVCITAAGPTFIGPLVKLDGSLGAHDVIVRHLRFCDDPDVETGDNLRIQRGAYNMVIDHCSLRRGGDGALDINNDVHDVTIQWCLIGATIKNQLIRTNVQNLSLHHNLYLNGAERNPQLDEAAGPIDFVNNVVYNWGHNYGTRIRNASGGNLVKNFWMAGPESDAGDAVIIVSDAGRVYSEGNVVPPGADASGNWPTRLPAPPVTEMDPGTALSAVTAEAGAQPRDEEDRALVAEMNMAASVPAGAPAGVPVLAIRPHPVRSVAVVTYVLSRAEQIELSLFDAQGRKVQSLREGMQGSGTHQLRWKAPDLSPGTYLLRMTAGGQVFTRKLLYIP